jgi:hypothetical protein
MGVCAEEIAANGGGENGISSGKAHHVGDSPTKDRDGTKGKVGEDTGRGQEGGVVPWGVFGFGRW